MRDKRIDSIPCIVSNEKNKRREEKRREEKRRASLL